MFYEDMPYIERWLQRNPAPSPEVMHFLRMAGHPDAKRFRVTNRGEARTSAFDTFNLWAMSHDDAVDFARALFPERHVCRVVELYVPCYDGELLR